MKVIYIKSYIIVIYVLLCLSITIGGIIGIINEAQVVTTNATPVTNKVIILDAGHGLPDEG